MRPNPTASRRNLAFGPEYINQEWCKYRFSQPTRNHAPFVRPAYGFAESVALLMRAGCSLYAAYVYSNPLQMIIRRCVEQSRMKLSKTLLEHCEAILSIFITSLAERRRRIYNNLATVPIPEGIINSCWAQTDRVFDEHLSCIEDALKYHNVMPSSASARLSGLRTVYHVRYWTKEIAEELWQAGFRDIDVSDRCGQRPLSKCRSYYDVNRISDVVKEIELVDWLVEKGANIYYPIGNDYHSEARIEFTDLDPERRALHHIAANISILIRERELEAMKYHTENFVSLPSGCLDCLSESSTQLMATNFSSPSRDRCLCACSSRGCTTSTILQKSWVNWFKDHSDVSGLDEEAWPLHTTECLMVLLEPHNTCEDWLINEIIRFNTFQELQLRHICCRYAMVTYVFTEPEPDETYTEGCIGPEPNKVYTEGFIDPELNEVYELRDEDSEGIKLLEDLMTEFQHKRGDQNCMNFLQGYYWTAKMAEVRRTRGEVDIEKSRQIGVVWNEEQFGDEL